MDDATLAKASLAVFSAGMILLFIVTTMVLPRHMAISSITSDIMGDSVQVTGKLESVSRSNGNIFLKVGDPSGSINVVVFQDNARKMNIDNLQEGKNSTISGRVGMYKSEIEVIADEIKVI